MSKYMFSMSIATYILKPKIFSKTQLSKQFYELDMIHNTSVEQKGNQLTDISYFLKITKFISGIATIIM